jgi:hypothetical protein
MGAEPLERDLVEADGKLIQLYPGRSAPHRKTLSTPIRTLLNLGLIRREWSHFDYGCGYGTAVWFLRIMGYNSIGWDPYLYAHAPKQASDIVTCLYVLDGIADRQQRDDALRECWDLTKRHLIIAGRKVSFRGSWLPYGDGWISKKRNVFQTVYTMKSMRDYVESLLELESHVVLNNPWTLVLSRNPEGLMTDLVEHVQQVIQPMRLPVLLEEREWVAQTRTPISIAEPGRTESQPFPRGWR